MYNEDNKFKKKRLYKREKDLYVGRRTALDPIGLNIVGLELSRIRS